MSNDGAIALVATACRFPDANSPAALLANTLAGRQSFRAIPPQRLVLDDYELTRIGEADSITRVPAGLLTDWQFDARRFRIPRNTVESADLTHWLALEVAADVVEAIGGLDALDGERTAVLVANTLTGEFSRTAQLRLRWPWLDAALDRALREAGITAADGEAVRSSFREHLRERLGAPNEETLAGGLSNTIAGRIANYFDLHGGAWSIDAACASSLVAVANAAELIASERADAVIVAAVDLSLDPFELVGFSRNSALAPNSMRVFDARAEGFWPGEGAGAVLLMRADMARKRGLATALEVAGWGIASDGRGGLTRPEVSGQQRALVRAYAQCGQHPARLGYVEAHGTGTAIGDPVEVRALAAFVGARAAALPIASIKGNIGHAKAAAGMAGLIRAAEALRDGVVPPHAGCDVPHPVFAETGDRLRVSLAPEPWPRDRPLAGVSSFGFGGVNAHVVLSRANLTSRPGAGVPAAPAARNAELFLFRASQPAGIRHRLEALASRAPTLSLAEFGDAAAAAARTLASGSWRLAFTAATPGQLQDRIDQALAVLDGRDAPDITFAEATQPARIGFAFPGQAAPVRLDGGAWTRRFPDEDFLVPATGDGEGTETAQLAIAAGSLKGLALLDRLGLRAEAAIGHSLGELVALSWAGALPRARLGELAAARGAAMATMPGGAMIRLGCAADRAASLITGLPLVIACINAPAETVVAGDADAVAEIKRRAPKAGIDCLQLRVSHAFHTPTMALAAPPLVAALAGIGCRGPRRAIASTITGDWLDESVDLPRLLSDQLAAPVRWDEAARLFAQRVDAVIEVGAGAGLSRLLEPLVPHVGSLDVGATTMLPALEAIGMAFVIGAPLDPAPLFDGPEIRPFAERAPTLLTNPCGAAASAAPPLPAAAVSPSPVPDQTIQPAGDAQEVMIRLLAAETGLPAAAISIDDRFLDDLHLNSLAVSRLVARCGQALGRQLPGFRTAFANSCVREIADAFTETEAFDTAPARDVSPTGPAPWIRRFAIEFERLVSGAQIAHCWHRAGEVPATEDGASGLLIDLSPEWNARRDAATLVAQCQAAIGRYAHLAIRHDGAALSGFARSIAAEELFASVRLIQGPADPEVLDRAVSHFDEVIWHDGGWVTKRLAIVAPPDAALPAGGGSMLVTGGARGIAAECALHVARRRQIPLILAGRTDPNHPEVAATLARIAETSVPARYVQVDVSDSRELKAGVEAAAAEIGHPSLLIHAAGVNEPQPFARLDAGQIDRTLRAKIDGLRGAVDACGDRLSRVVAFGSIIGQLGLPGEAHYALANAEQTRLLAEIGAARPGLSVLSLEWSVWAGAGMGERLGTIERLRAEGVEAMSLDAALAQFEALVFAPVQGSLIVAGRHGMSAPLPQLSCSRFLDRVLVHTPGVEAVIETDLTAGRDLYLDDHVIESAPVVPGVLLLEAMAQAAAIVGEETPEGLADVAFRTAVVCDATKIPIRIGVLRELDGSIRAEIRSSSDGFAAPAVEARFVAALDPPPPPPDRPTPLPAAALYGPLFFHGSRFRRVAAIGALSSRHIAARLTVDPGLSWFSSYEPQELALGDPGARDAALHALQCCVPHHRLVPVRAVRIDRYRGGAPVRLWAEERWSRGDDFAFDIFQVDAADKVVEIWREAVFHAVGPLDATAILSQAPMLTDPYLERRAREETGDDTLRLTLVDDPRLSRSERRACAAARLDFARAPGRRIDGKPDTGDDGRGVSFAHLHGVTMGVCSALDIGCDIASLNMFPSEDRARLWTVEETLRKLGSGAVVAHRKDGAFGSAGAERIVQIGSVPTVGAGVVTVAVGVKTRP